MTRTQFNRFLYQWYVKNGRHQLPWRSKPTPYRVMVSEIMLQQTQVDRVIPKFNTWIKQFPTIQALARANTRSVLLAWQGLGYNSRALRLQRAALAIVKNHKGVIPKTRTELEALPGIGPYTAGAVMAFAYNNPEVFIETNIRRVFIYHFFKNRTEITDNELLPIIKRMLDTKNPKKWYSALMDYGSTIPRQILHNPNLKSKHYTKQSKFNGSIRQVRGAILRHLLQHNSTTIQKLSLSISGDKTAINQALLGLAKDGVVRMQGKSVHLAK